MKNYEKVIEIKKALKCCLYPFAKDCVNCPYEDNPKCKELLATNSLLLINALLNEIEAREYLIKKLERNTKIKNDGKEENKNGKRNKEKEQRQGGLYGNTRNNF